MWVCNIVRRYVEWIHLMGMFIPSANVNQLPKNKYMLWKEVGHKIFGDRSKEVWKGPREFDHGHIHMYFCQIGYAKVILGVQID